MIFIYDIDTKMTNPLNKKTFINILQKIRLKIFDRTISWI